MGLDLIVDTPYTVMTTRAPEVLKITLLVAKKKSYHNKQTMAAILMPPKSAKEEIFTTCGTK